MMVRCITGAAVVLLVICLRADGFDINPMPRAVQRDRGYAAQFYYFLRPWPPPCCKTNDTSWDHYRDVTLEFLFKPSSGVEELLCTNQYLDGVWVNGTEQGTDSGKCSDYHPRVPDFEPDFADKVEFVLERTQYEDMGDYELKISYGGLVQRDHISLTVIDWPPVPDIDSSAGLGEVEVGDKVEMTCTAGDSNPPPRLEWTRGAYDPMPPVDSGVADDWQGTSWSTVVIEEASRFDHGISFICTATNTRGSSTNATTIHVRFEPYVQLKPCGGSETNYRVVEGRTMHMRCEVDAYPEVSEYKWYREGDEITSAFNKTELAMSSVKRNMSGIFRCSAKNELAEKDRSCELDVQYGPEQDFPHEYEIGQGENLTFPCTTDSNPQPEQYVWTREGDRDFRQEQQELSLAHVQPEDAGNYSCAAVAMRNPTGSSPYPYTGRGYVFVHIIFAPRWQPYALTKFAGVPGSEASLVCTLQGYPQLTHSWQFQGQGIAPGPRYEITTEGTVSTLLIKSVIQEDFNGVYTCIGENSEGQDRFDVQLLTPGAPDEPQLCTVHNVTDRTVALQCIPGYDGGGTTSIQADLEEEKAGKSVERANIGSYTTPETQVVIVDGLEPNTNYTLHLYAINEHGRSSGVHSVKIRTADGIPDPTPPPPNVGAIVGGVFGGLLLIALIAGAVLYVRKYGMPKLPEKKEKPPKYLDRPLRSDDIGARYGESIPSRPPRSKDYLKEKSVSFEDEPIKAIPNEYIPHPGMTRIAFVSGQTNNGYKNHAYETDELETCLDGPDSPNDFTVSAMVHATPGSRNPSRNPELESRRGQDDPDQNYKNQLRQSQAGLIGQGALLGEMSNSRVDIRDGRQQQQTSGARPDVQFQNNKRSGGQMEPRENMSRAYDGSNQSLPQSRGISGLPSDARSRENIRMSRDQMTSSRDNLAEIHGQESGTPRHLGQKNDVHRKSRESLVDPRLQVRANQDGVSTNPSSRMGSRMGSRENLSSSRAGSRTNLALLGESRTGSHENLTSSGGSRMGSRSNLSVMPDQANGSRDNQRHTWEFPRNRLQVSKKLGEGSYGEVWWASTEGIAGRQGTSYVAIKMVKELSPPEEKQNLLKELELMKTLPPHQNVVSLLGCCSEREPIFIIMEYAGRGNLQDFLRSNRRKQGLQYDNTRPLTTKDLMNFAIDIASGMEHVASRQLLHRDLAARNILVSSRLVAKVSDFGLARDIIHRRQYESKTQRRLPIRWMAPEALLDGVYTSKTDVWAFGVVLWEIVTLGSSPYPGLSGGEVMDMIQQGYRMDKPRHCSDAMYNVMRDCWQDDPDKRPSFAALKSRLHQILSDVVRDPNGNKDVVEMRENMFDILDNPPGEKC